MPGRKMLVVNVGVAVVVEMIVRLSGRIIVGVVVGRCLEKDVRVPRLVRSGGIFVDAVSCLQPAGGRFGYAASASRRRRRYQT